MYFYICISSRPNDSRKPLDNLLITRKTFLNLNRSTLKIIDYERSSVTWSPSVTAVAYTLRIRSVYPANGKYKVLHKYERKLNLTTAFGDTSDLPLCLCFAYDFEVIKYSRPSRETKTPGYIHHVQYSVNRIKMAYYNLHIHLPHDQEGGKLQEITRQPYDHPSRWTLSRFNLVPRLNLQTFILTTPKCIFNGVEFIN